MKNMNCPSCRYLTDGMLLREALYDPQLSRYLPSLELIDRYDIIILDEAQFFSSEVIDQVESLLNEDKYVIVSGLDKDCFGKPFSKFMQWALCLADDVTKLTAICAKCGAPSTMAKLVSMDPSEIIEGNIIIEDENHKYVPMCRKCMQET